MMDRRYKKRIDRYWSKMEKRCERGLSDIDTDSWFDLWHMHPDWDGKGNARPENRHKSIELTYKYLKKAEALTEYRGKELQCFAILTIDTMDNSVYIHSQNPNGSEFPFKYDGVHWGYFDAEINSIVNSDTHEVGIIYGEIDETIFIRKKA
ncbi:Uncharacterised protein [Shewanella putrefaciens]|nr:Uncharacterised protein [Shewanella putrefaciens]